MTSSITALSALSWVTLGTATGIINTLAGGGSLITLPVLIFCGLPASQANATNRIGIGAQSLIAILTFVRSGRFQPTQVFPRLLVVLPGSFIGASLASNLAPEGLQLIIGVVLLVLMVLLVLRPQRWLKAHAAAPLWVQLLMFFGVGFYGGFLQAGVGLILLMTSTLVAGEDLVTANMTKTLLVGSLTGPALAVFIYEGLVHVPIGMCLAVGSMLGGYIGARLTLSHGAPVIRVLLIIVVTISATRLLELW
ncbi:MAG: sulfite exporter TauE/SafE family protein [Myxococcales bacterium]|nr:sulfite exporter TauE/SafE family protein [Myxococcales bacterium]